MTTPFLVCAAVTAISALVSLGFSVAAVAGTTGRTRTLAFYTCARSIAFAGVALVPFANKSGPWLQAVAIGMIVVQALDAAIGVTIADRVKTLGPAATALANLIALGWFLGT